MTALPPPLHYLALGDSYTIGEAVASRSRWPVILVERLRRAGVVIDDPRIVAVTGWTTNELAHGMGEATLAADYDLVTLQIGVNNQYRGRSAEDYRGEFAGLLASAIALAGGRSARVVVVSVPDWGVTPFARDQGREPATIAVALDAFNMIAREQCDRAGAHFVDITTISRHHPELVAEDGLHPSAAQYSLWAEAILPVAREALGPLVP